jgi:hypothetical protein
MGTCSEQSGAAGMWAACSPWSRRFPRRKLARSARQHPRAHVHGLSAGRLDPPVVDLLIGQSKTPPRARRGRCQQQDERLGLFAGSRAFSRFVSRRALAASAPTCSARDFGASLTPLAAVRLFEPTCGRTTPSRLSFANETRILRPRARFQRSERWARAGAPERLLPRSFAGAAAAVNVLRAGCLRVCASSVKPAYDRLSESRAERTSRARPARSYAGAFRAGSPLTSQARHLPERTFDWARRLRAQPAPCDGETTS